jgi:hypothetical protein
MKVGDLIECLPPKTSALIYQADADDATKGRRFKDRKWRDISSKDVGLVVKAPYYDNTFTAFDDIGYHHTYTCLVLFGEQLLWIEPRDFMVIYESR